MLHWNGRKISFSQDLKGFGVHFYKSYTVKHVYFASIKFSRFEYNREIKYMQIFRISNHHKFICIEYEHFRDAICSILGIT